MSFVASNTMTREEAEDYMKVYHATVNLLANAVVLFDSLSKTHPREGDRALFRANALEATRELELLSNKLSSVLLGTALVRRPSPTEIATSQSLAQELADLAARQARAEAMVRVVTNGLAAFNRINAARDLAAIPAAATPAPVPVD